MIVVGEVVDVATEGVDVELELVGEGLGDSHLVIVSMGGLDRETQDERVQRSHCQRTGQQNVFERRGLEDAIVRDMNDDIRGGEITRDSQAGARSVLVDAKLVVIPAQAGADGPFAEADQLLHKRGLLEIKTAV